MSLVGNARAHEPKKVTTRVATVKPRNKEKVPNN
jgi:hypothetical protein